MDVYFLVGACTGVLEFFFLQVSSRGNYQWTGLLVILVWWYPLWLSLGQSFGFGRPVLCVWFAEGQGVSW